MTHIQPVGAGQEPLFENAGQASARLSKQLKNDKARAQRNRIRELSRLQACLGRTSNKELRKQLRQRIQLLEDKQKQEQKFL